MECLRDIRDFVEDAQDRDIFDPVRMRLPSVEKEMTMILRQLRALIDVSRALQRKYYNERMISEAEHDQGTSKEVIMPRGGTSKEVIAIMPPRGTPGDTSAGTSRARDESLASWRSDVMHPMPPSCAERNLDANWTASRYSRGKHCSRKGKAPIVTPSRPLATTAAHEVEIPVSTNMSLRCIEIPDLNAIQHDGILYYVPRLCRFAIRLAGFVLYGNIGIVYASEASPQRIHDCTMYPSCNMETCHYYHNPIKCRGSTNIRNFAATSWLYSDKVTSGSKKMRKLASRPKLDTDILTVTSGDLAYYNEQLMHDLLCGIIMNYYVKRDVTQDS